MKKQTSLSTTRSNRGRHSYSGRRFLATALWSGALASITLLAPQAAHAAPRPKAGSIEPWPGRRVVLLLPLQLGAGFNADRDFGQAILTRAEQNLQAQLEKTGKFSVIQGYRFNPLIQRALQEKRLTEEQVTNLGQTPSVENATTVLNQFTFDRTPMIAQFSLEEVRSSGTAERPSVQAQVSGRLYELGNQVAFKSPVITSDPVQTGRNNIERYLGAADNAFMQIAAEMVAPLEDIQLPAAPETTPATGTPEAGTTPAPTPTTPAPAAATPTPAAPANPVTLPGDTPIAGASSRGSASAVPQAPAAQQPSSITVPNTPGAR
jgi:hypothetical protein